MRDTLVYGYFSKCCVYLVLVRTRAHPRSGWCSGAGIILQTDASVILSGFENLHATQPIPVTGRDEAFTANPFYSSRSSGVRNKAEVNLLRTT